MPMTTVAVIASSVMTAAVVVNVAVVVVVTDGIAEGTGRNCSSGGSPRINGLDRPSGSVIGRHARGARDRDRASGNEGCNRFHVFVGVVVVI
jgi:hypothetical protein